MRKLEMTRYQQRQLAVVVGSRIQAFRRERRWSRSVLANFLEIKREWLADYETGIRLPPPFTLYQLASVFGVSAGALLDEEPAERPAKAEELLQVLRRAEMLSKEDRRVVAEFFEGVLKCVKTFRHA